MKIVHPTAGSFNERTVLLDAGPLGMISNPNAIGVNRECYERMEALVVNGFQVGVPSKIGNWRCIPSSGRFQ